MGDKPVQFSHHAKEQLRYRGADDSEVEETIRSAPWKPAELGRLECRKDFFYGQEWNGKRYQSKQVRPIFVDEPDRIFVVTVYIYYF